MSDVQITPAELEEITARQKARADRLVQEALAEETARIQAWELSRVEGSGVTPGAHAQRLELEFGPLDEPLALTYEAVEVSTGSVESGDESKKDDGKAPYGLIPNEALEALAHLYGLGARKYSPRGWESGMAWQRIFDAMERHGRKWWGGETHDAVDGQHHLIAVAWCAFALYCYEVRDIGEDNRP